MIYKISTLAKFYYKGFNNSDSINQNFIRNETAATLSIFFELEKNLKRDKQLKLNNQENIP